MKFLKEYILNFLDELASNWKELKSEIENVQRPLRKYLENEPKCYKKFRDINKLKQVKK